MKHGGYLAIGSSLVSTAESDECILWIVIVDGFVG